MSAVTGYIEKDDYAEHRKWRASLPRRRLWRRLREGDGGQQSTINVPEGVPATLVASLLVYRFERAIRMRQRSDWRLVRFGWNPSTPEDHTTLSEGGWYWSIAVEAGNRIAQAHTLLTVRASGRQVDWQFGQSHIWWGGWIAAFMFFCGGAVVIVGAMSFVEALNIPGMVLTFGCFLPIFLTGWMKEQTLNSSNSLQPSIQECLNEAITAVEQMMERQAKAAPTGTEDSRPGPLTW